MGTVAGILLSSLPLTIGAAAFGIIALWRLDRSPSTNPAAGAECAVPVAQPVPVERIAPSLDPEVVLAALKGAAEQVAPVVATHLWLVDAPTGTLRQIAAWGLNAPTGQPTLLNSDDVLAQAVTTGRAEIGPLATMRAAGDATTVWRYALPIDAGEAEGVAGVDFSSAEQPDLSEMPKLMATMRASLSGALGLHVSKVELETARHLVEATRELSRILDPREVLVASLHRAMALSNAESGSIMLLDEHTGKLLIEVAEGLPAEVVHSTALAEGEGIAGWVLASRQPMLIEDLPARTPAARRHGIRSAASVPLMDDDGILGVLNVGSRSFPARFTDSHLASLGVLAKQTATALRNARAIAESRSLYFETLKALAIALETKDPYSRGGTDRVLEVAEDLGLAFGLPSEELHALRVAALLHDIGMASTGDGVLKSDRPLSTVERALLKMHPQIASEILSEVPALKQVVPIVYHHHEWYDGQGYLDGIAGEGIPLGARILAVADAYVAMTSPRPYRLAFSDTEALQELAEKAGTQFDPSVVDALKDVLGGGPNRVPGPSSGRA
jgi:HD-GYP domain-containing protein (c-di-GMP phosphodiesterase class II)